MWSYHCEEDRYTQEGLLKALVAREFFNVELDFKELISSDLNNGLPDGHRDVAEIPNYISIYLLYETECVRYLWLELAVPPVD